MDDEIKNNFKNGPNTRGKKFGSNYSNQQDKGMKLRSGMETQCLSNLNMRGNMACVSDTTDGNVRVINSIAINHRVTETTVTGDLELDGDGNNGINLKNTGDSFDTAINNANSHNGFTTSSLLEETVQQASDNSVNVLTNVQQAYSHNGFTTSSLLEETVQQACDNSVNVLMNVQQANSHNGFTTSSLLEETVQQACDNSANVLSNVQQANSHNGFTTSSLLEETVQQACDNNVNISTNVQQNYVPQTPQTVTNTNTLEDIIMELCDKLETQPLNDNYSNTKVDENAVCSLLNENLPEDLNKSLEFDPEDFELFYN